MHIGSRLGKISGFDELKNEHASISKQPQNPSVLTLHFHLKVSLKTQIVNRLGKISGFDELKNEHASISKEP